MIKIPVIIYRQIVDLAQAQPTIETCGYLGGSGGEVKAIFPMRNMDRSAEHFSFDPEEQFAVLDKARGLNLELIAVFHSHPETPARMSAEDIRWANDTNVLYVIYSLAANELKAFRIDEDKQVSEVPVVVVVEEALAKETLDKDT